MRIQDQVQELHALLRNAVWKEMNMDTSDGARWSLRLQFPNIVYEVSTCPLTARLQPNLNPTQMERQPQDPQEKAWGPAAHSQQQDTAPSAEVDTLSSANRPEWERRLPSMAGLLPLEF